MGAHQDLAGFRADLYRSRLIGVLDGLLILLRHGTQPRAHLSQPPAS
jgi:hypothetical protein